MTQLKKTAVRLKKVALLLSDVYAVRQCELMQPATSGPFEPTIQYCQQDTVSKLGFGIMPI